MYRTAADRKAEAARYQQMTEAATVPVIELYLCHYKEQSSKLELSSSHTGGRFPSVLKIRSHHTGRQLTFTPVKPDDIMYDSDGWDGEQMIYRPTETVEKVKMLVVHHFG